MVLRLMIRTFVFSVCAFLVITPLSNAADYVVDPAHTSITFKVGHWSFSRVQGRFNAVSGRFSFDPKRPEAGSVFIEVETGSIDTNHAERDAHLREPTFFNVKRFPKAIFKSTRIVKTGKNSGLLTGRLTLLGVSRMVTLNVKYNGTAKHPLGDQFKKYKGVIVAGFSATASLRRSRFGMTNAIPKKSDRIELTIEVEGWRVKKSK